jgi:hypothetical protein
LQGFLDHAHVGVGDVAEVGIGRGVVDQDVEPPEGAVDFADELLERGRLTLVRGDGGSLAAGCDDFRGNDVEVGLLAAGNDDVRALPGE